MKDILQNELQAQITYRLIESLSKSEKRYQKLVDSLHEIVFEMKIDSTINYLNPAWQKILGYSIKEGLGHSLYDFILKKDKEKLRKFIDSPKKPSLRKKEQLSLRVMHKNNSILWFIVSITIENDNILGSMLDITERKMAKKDLLKITAMKAAAKEAKKRTKEIEKTNRILKETQTQLIQSAKLASLGEMSAGLAHELNNPLQFIMGFNDGLKAYFERNEQATFNDINKYIYKIDKNCDRMKKIIQHFREFCRQDKIHFRTINMNDVIEKSFILFKEQFRHHNIKIQINLSPDDLLITGDTTRLEQVFTNLIANSRDAVNSISQKESRTINVSSKKKENFAIVDFTDNGHGIEKSNLNRIFDPFYTTKEVGKGTGLGLSISYGIIQEHNGNISCHTTSDKGTTFRIKIPLYLGKKKPYYNVGEEKLSYHRCI